MKAKHVTLTDSLIISTSVQDLENKIREQLPPWANSIQVIDYGRPESSVYVSYQSSEYDMGICQLFASADPSEQLGKWEWVIQYEHHGNDLASVSDFVAELNNFLTRFQNSK